MFDIFFFGWRKASKCKKLINQVQSRLKLLKNKRKTIVKNYKDDVAHLLRHGHQHIAFDRVGWICKEEAIGEAYDMLDSFCEFIVVNLPHIRKNKNSPADVMEAISTLVFASARCGDLPELYPIRKLFGERYGQSFVTAAIELQPGNLVNDQVNEGLSNKPVTDDAKYKLLDEISSSCLQRSPLRLEYHPEARQEQDKSLVVWVDPSTPAQIDDEIEEYKRSPMSRDEYDQDQRVFLFRSSPVSSGGKSTGDGGDGKEKARKKRRRRSPSKESEKPIDMESRIYYDTSYKKSRVKTDSGQGKLILACTDTRTVHQADDCCSVDRPCYVCTNRDPPPPQKVNGAAITKRVQAPTPPPYSRAVTMPTHRAKLGGGDNEFARSISLPAAKEPRYVHPNLPDWDEFEATFVALKKGKLLKSLVR